MRPFCIVEDEDFNLITKFKLPCRKTLCSLLPEVYLEVESQIHKIILNQNFLWLTIDAWSSIRNDSYFSVMAHFLTEDFRNVTFVLGVLQTFSHTSEHLGNEVKELCKIWGIWGKIQGIVADNTNSMPCLCEKIELEFFGCYGHKINLCYQHSLKQVESLLSAVRSIVSYFNRSIISKETFLKQQESNSQRKITLKQDICTRWNSTFLMLESVIENQMAIRNSLILLNRSDLLLKKSQWNELKFLKDLLEPFYKATNILSTSTSNVYSSFVPIILKLQKEIEIIPTGVSEIIKKIYIEMKDNLYYYFSDLMDKNSLMICMLDPRFKSLPFISKKERKEVKNQILISLLKLKPEKNNEEFNKELKELESIYGSVFLKADTIEKELEIYLSDFVSPSVDINSWWKDNKLKYPTLYILAQKLLSRPPTSVSCERLWSDGGFIINERRSKLDTDVASMLIFLHHDLSELKKLGIPFVYQQK